MNVTPPPAVAPPERQRPQVAPPAEEEEPIAPAPEPVAPPARRAHRAVPQGAPPPVVVYQQVPAPPPQVIIITPGYGGGYAPGRPVRPVPPPPVARKPRWQSEVGLNLRVEGLAIGQARGAASTAGMGGVGLSLRYRPIPHFAFDLGVDVLAGNDYNGFQRVEVPVALNGMLYLNPRSRVQVYLMGGAHISRAQVRSEFAAPQLRETDDGRQYGANYTYFGGQGGGGLEFRLSRRVALNLDALGFVRKRIDDGKTPEFIDYQSGRTTNTSGGALIRGGLTFWW
ncbi:Hypothetical protein A7982_08249 [Minicystis rosea]|nr:Hypothetical protein A7982_08249 [Minicystis rosea]